MPRRPACAVLAAVALVALTGCDPFQPWRHELVSGTPEGVGGAGDSSMASGTELEASVVVFVSDADDLVPEDGNGVSDVFVRNRSTGTTQLVSVAAGELTVVSAPSSGPSPGQGTLPAPGEAFAA